MHCFSTPKNEEDDRYDRLALKRREPFPAYESNPVDDADDMINEEASCYERDHLMEDQADEMKTDQNDAPAFPNIVQPQEIVLHSGVEPSGVAANGETDSVV